MNELKRWWIATSIVGIVGFGVFGCGTGNGPDSSSSGCIEAASESSSTPGTSPLGKPCGSTCSCATGQTQLATATCADACAPFNDSHNQPYGTCISFDATTFYCTRICTTTADCMGMGTCAFGPLHQIGGIIVDQTMYCIK